MQDNALLTLYTQNHSQAAFAQLLTRHLPLVYRICRRELGSVALAEDAAPVVFLLLARKAKSLYASPSLAGWLYQTSVFVAKDIRKQEARRTRRGEAAMQEAIHAQTVPLPEWEAVEPLLNTALSAKHGSGFHCPASE
ncbi:MAG: RNA polymerase sigma factor [Janthinobacterium lividum]